MGRQIAVLIQAAGFALLATVSAHAASPLDQSLGIGKYAVVVDPATDKHYQLVCAAPEFRAPFMPGVQVIYLASDGSAPFANGATFRCGTGVTAATRALPARPAAPPAAAAAPTRAPTPVPAPVPAPAPVPPTAAAPRPKPPASRTTPMPAPAPAPAQVLVNPATNAPPPPNIDSCAPDYQSQDVLLIGDSNSSWMYRPYAPAVASQIQMSGDARVVTYAVGATAGKTWLSPFTGSHNVTSCDIRSGVKDKLSAFRMPSFPELVRDRNPKAVVINLGINDINNYCASVQGNDASAYHWMREARRLAESARASSRAGCVWVLPFNSNKGDPERHCRAVANGIRGAINTLRDAVRGSCEIVDTPALCPMSPENFDAAGMHVLAGSAQALGTCVGRGVNAALQKLNAGPGSGGATGPVPAPYRSGR